MARKLIDVNETEGTKENPIDISEVVSRYFANKQVEKDVKSVLSKDNETIKSYMTDAKLDKAEFGGYKVSISVQDKSTMNEAKLLNFCKTHNITGVIKTMEYVDTDALEDVIYREEIPKEVLAEMDSCKEAKFVTTLRVTEVKKKED